MHRAVDNGNPEAVQFLLDRGADPNLQNKKGQTPLHYAAYNNNPKIAKFLIEHDADVNIPNKNGLTPYQLTDNKEIKNIIQRKLSGSLSELETEIPTNNQQQRYKD